MENVSTDITSEIRSANNKFEEVFAAGDARGMAELYTINGMLLPSGSEILKGTQAIENYWQAAMDMGVKQVKLDTVEVEHHGATAIELGNYTLTGTEGLTLDHGKYMVVWKRESNQWKLHKDIWNSNAGEQ